MKKIISKTNLTNVELGKKLFYDCYGSKVCLDRTYGTEYSNCNIAIDLETEWRKDIIKILENHIDELYGQEKMESINKYLQIVSSEHQISKLIELLDEGDIDSFTRLQLCEMLTEIYIRLRNSLNIEIVRRNIEKNITLLTNNSITIHESYKKCNWLEEGFFSKDAISKRIGRILDKITGLDWHGN